MSYDITAKELNELDVKARKLKKDSNSPYFYIDKDVIIIPNLDKVISILSASRFRAQLTKIELNTKIVK